MIMFPKFHWVFIVLILFADFIHADVIEQSFSIDLEKIRSISPEAGTIINKDNVDSFTDILPPKLGELIKDGLYSITVGEPLSFRPHQAYIDASVLYLGATSLDEKPGVVLNYTAGRPFPEQPSLDDPRAGDKLAWNMRYTYAYDGGEVADFFWQYRDMHKEKIERTLSFYASSLRFMHRHVEEPLPALPRNPSKIFNALYLRVISPPDLRGTQLLIQRMEDDTKPEQAWLYLATHRRVRRLASGQTTDAFLGSDIMIEDFLGYNGRIKDQKWSYKGTEWVLLPFFKHNEMSLEEVNRQQDGYRFVGFHGKADCFPNVTWQLRKAYVLEAVPYDERHPLSKRLFYVDVQTMQPAYGNIFDRSGKLWKVAIAGFSHPDAHHPVNKGSGTPMIDVVSMIDIQAMHCTTLQFKAMLPHKKLRETDFTVQALRAKGR
jgi:Protein of unknown function (DUF1329)